MTELEGSYQACERISRNSGSNFYRSFAFLRRDRRRAMNALYAFSRIADDATDAASTAEAWNLDSWLEWLRNLHRSNPRMDGDRTMPKSLDAIRTALADATERFQIPIEMLCEIAQGVDMDTRPLAIQSWDDLRSYGFRVASSVGICCTAIWTSGQPPTADDPLWHAAVDCGLAFQLTNILRDLREDAKRGRCYLPSDELTLFRIDRDRWLDSLAKPIPLDFHVDGDWRSLLEIQFERAHALFDRGWAVSQALEPDGLRMFSLMWHTYRQLLQAIEQTKDTIPTSRTQLSISQKLALVSSHVFTPCFIRKLKTQARLTQAPYCSSNLKQKDAPKSYPYPRVAVLGGGLAGINAAMSLARHGCHVTLFESKSRLGGRVGSFLDPDSGSPVDYCQHVGMACCTELQRWIARTGQKSDWKSEDTLHFVSRTGKRVAVKGWTLPAPFHLSGFILSWPDLSLTDRIRIAAGMAALLQAKPSAAFERQPALQWLRTHYQSESTIRNYWATILVSALGEQIDRVAMGPVRKVLIDGFAKTRTAYHLMVPQRSLSELVDVASRTTLKDLQVEVRCSSTIFGIHRHSTGKWELDSLRPSSHAYPKISQASNPAEPDHFDALVVAVPWHRIASLFAEQEREKPNVEIASDQSRAASHERFEQVRVASDLESSPITGIHTWWDRPWLDRPHAIVIDHLCQWVFPGPSANNTMLSNDENASPSRRETYYQIVISGSRDLPRGDTSAVLAAVQKDLAEVFPDSSVASLIRGRVVTDPQSVFSVAPGHEACRLSQDCLGHDGIFVAGDWTLTGWPATMEGALRSGLLAAEGALAYLQRPARLLNDR